jgi:hypothetical protein
MRIGESRSLRREHQGSLARQQRPAWISVSTECPWCTSRGELRQMSASTGLTTHDGRSG